MPRTRSRPQRWAVAVRDAQDALNNLQNALSELTDIKDEYQGWLDNLPENLQGSSLYEKLEAVTSLDFDVVGDIENTLSEAESVELPQGFGRD